MIYLALRTSGTSPTQPGAPVYNSYTAMANAIQALYPLLDDITVYVQGGQSFLDSFNLSPDSSVVGNGHTILITTDPGEQSTPALIGEVRFSPAAVESLTLSATKIKIAGDRFGKKTSIIIKVEDCFIVTNWGAYGDGTGIFTGAAGSWVKNCTIALPASSPGYREIAGNTSTVAFDNNLFVINSSDPNALLGGTGTNNTTFNYGSGTIDFQFTPSNFVNSILNTNPNLVDILIQSPDEAVVTVIARNAHLTAGSTACLDNADPATATSSDITGVVRPQGAVADRGAYEFPVVSTTTTSSTSTTTTTLTTTTLTSTSSSTSTTTFTTTTAEPVRIRAPRQIPKIRRPDASNFGVPFLSNPSATKRKYKKRTV